MKEIVLSTIVLAVLCLAPVLHSQAVPSDDTVTQSAANMPSTEEVNDLLSKASEYVAEYQTTFKNAKPTLDKTPTPGFVEKANQLSSQANELIASVKKNGPTGYALVDLVAVLDDMSLNAARASAMAMLVAVKSPTTGADNPAIQDFQDLAQAEKNCYDISELILHSTLRLISAEEQVLHALTDKEK